MHSRGCLGEEHRRLAGGVASPHDHDFFGAAQLGLHEGSGVVDTRPFELREVVHCQLPVLGTSGENDGPGRHPRPFVDPHLVGLALARDARGALGDRDVGPELFGLGEGAGGELLAGDAGREAEVVLDPGTGPGLSARSVRFQDNRGITLLQRL